MLDHIKSNAELVRSTARSQLDFDVEYDRAGVEWLDGFVTRQFQQGNPTNVSGLVSTLGSFFGECIAQTYGGEWFQDAEHGWCIRFDEKNVVFPFAKIEKHLRNGTEDSVLSMFDIIPLVFNIE